MNFHIFIFEGPVSFELDSKNVTTRRGYPVTIICEALGDHPIRMNWKHNGRSLEFISKRYKSYFFNYSRKIIIMIVNDLIIEPKLVTTKQ